MADQKGKKGKGNDRFSGLGRDLSDLLEDNDGIPNMKSNVLLRREDGSRVKIYDKTGGEDSNGKKSSSVKKR